MNNKAIKSICISSVSAMAMLSFAPSAHAELADEGAADDVIIVTAGKREQLLKDVSGSISALSEDDLRNLQAQSLSDYITRVPGVVFNDYQPGVSEVVIRGVASTTYHEANQATTGYYINEIPLTEPGFPLVIPDVDTFDLKRVEVLRGPQGTLFGSSSLGGAINYVVNTADASGFDAGFEGSLASTRRAGEVSYGAKAMVNVPIIEDQLAVRLVAFQRFDAGYLDNTGTGVDGSNDLRVRGLRGSLVWTPTDKTTFSVLSMYQEYDLDDQTYVLFGAPETFERSTNVPEYQDKFQQRAARHEIGDRQRKEQGLGVQQIHRQHDVGEAPARTAIFFWQTDRKQAAFGPHVPEFFRQFVPLPAFGHIGAVDPANDAVTYFSDCFGILAHFSILFL
jgi:iron complex outermembrane recepter protein